MAEYKYNPRTHKLIRHTFMSMGECIDHAKKSAKSDAYSHNASESWTGTASFEDACQMALNGWDGARERITQLLTEIRTEVAEKVTTEYAPSWDTSGAVVDVDAYLLGEPECMIDFVPEPNVQDRPVVKVLVNTCYSAGFSADEILQRGSAICGLVDILMSLGFSVEVWAECSDGPMGRSDSQWFWSCLVLLKGVDDYVDVDSFAFALAHPSWLRRVMFGCMEGESDTVRRRFHFGIDGRNGYGKVGTLTATEDIGATVTVEGALLGVDGRSIHNPSDWIMDTLKSLGVTAEK